MERAAKSREGLEPGDRRAASCSHDKPDHTSAFQNRFGNRGVLTLLQMRARPAASSPSDPAGHVAAAAKKIADRGVNGSTQPLPFREQIQGSFGRHDVSSIEAHMGGAASEASEALGAQGYTSDRSVAFGGKPDLRTAAHEAAHVIQQRAGVHLKDGLGETGDAYERHADAVADRVVRGESAESLLDQDSGCSPT